MSFRDENKVLRQACLIVISEIQVSVKEIKSCQDPAKMDYLKKSLPGSIVLRINYYKEEIGYPRQYEE